MIKNSTRILSIFLLGYFSVVFADTLKIELQGLDSTISKNAQSRLKVLEDLQGQPLTRTKIENFYKQAPQEIKKALQPYGYFDVRVRGKLKQRGQVWIASFEIHQGPATKIDRLDIQVYGPGENNAELKKLLNNFPLHVGETFNTETYEKAKEKLFETLNNQGYIKAVLENNKILINERTRSASIIMHFNTGQRFYFGRINFEADVYSKSFLHRFVTIKQDEPFSSQKLLSFQQELASSFYFQTVVVTPDFEHAEDGRVPVNITVTPPKSQKYKFGIGYGTFTGPRLTAGVSLRRLTETGQHFDAQLRLSEVLSGVALKYYIPGQNPLTDQWIIGANYQKFSPEEGKSNSKTLSFGYDKKTPNYQSNLSLNYLMERFKVNNEPSRSSELLYPAWNLSYLNVDDLINPKFGKSFNLILQGASRELLSSTSFLQAELRGKYIYAPTDLSRIVMRGNFGYTIVRDLDQLPLSMRFFAGGLNTVRGYKESSIGPGKYLEVGSLEFQHQIVGNWTGAVFYDIGAASNHFNKGYRNGKGVGIIYNSVVGPIKVYVAKGKKYGFEFSIGPEF